MDLPAAPGDPDRSAGGTQSRWRSARFSRATAAEPVTRVRRKVQRPSRRGGTPPLPPDPTLDHRPRRRRPGRLPADRDRRVPDPRGELPMPLPAAPTTRYSWVTEVEGRAGVTGGPRKVPREFPDEQPRGISSAIAMVLPRGLWAHGMWAAPLISSGPQHRAMPRRRYGVSEGAERQS